jgi:excisionase family DNA binding protein
MQDLVLITLSKDEFKEMIKEIIVEALNRQTETTISHDNHIDKPMTVKEVSEFINLSVSTIYGLTHKRSIPYSKKGKRLYFNKLEIIKWVNEGRRKTVDEIERDAENYIIGKRKKS